MTVTRYLLVQDPPFLDRITIKQFVPNLAHGSRYAIFRTCLEDFQSAGFIAFSMVLSDADRIPSWFDMTAAARAAEPNTPGARLYELAGGCQGMSGRTLSNLPWVALTMYTRRVPCAMDEVISALETAIFHELDGKHGV